MSRGDRNIIKEAVADAVGVRKAAEAAARQKLLEQMSPQIKKLVESYVDDATDEDVDRVRRAKDGHGENEKWEESYDPLPEGDAKMKKDDEKELEKEGLGLENMFPGISEMGDEEDLELPAEAGMPPMDDADEMSYEAGMPMDDDEMDIEKEMASIPTLGENEYEEEEGDMDEELQIDEEGLKRAYEGIMKANSALREASVDWGPDVQSGFKDSYPASEWETEDSPPSDRGLEAKEKDNADWDKERPPKAQDYSVKEAIEKGLRENQALRQYVSYLEEQVAGAHSVIKKLRNEVNEVNLFNTKVVHVNEMINKFGKKLTNEQKRIVIERIDGAQSPREVKMVSESLKAAFKSAAGGRSLREGRSNRPRANASRAISSGSPDQQVLRESAGGNGGQKQRHNRWTEIAFS